MFNTVNASNYVNKCKLKREAIQKISNMFNTVNAII